MQMQEVREDQTLQPAMAEQVHTRHTRGHPLMHNSQNSNLLYDQPSAPKQETQL
jgi:hypothetical protein